MKRVFGFFLACCFCLTAAASFAASEAKQSASPAASQNADDESMLNRMGDWFATMGKSAEEKAKILRERKMKRATERAEKKYRKRQRTTQQSSKEMQQKMMMRTRDVQQGQRGRGK
jgi:membrane-bound lytic murein transglycosylase B